MFAASGFCWVCKVCSSFLPPSLVSSLSSFSLGLAATKSGSLSTQHYLFSFLLARVFSRDKGEGRRGRTGLIPGRSRSLGQPSPPAPNQPQDNQPIFVPSFFFFFFAVLLKSFECFVSPSSYFFFPLSLDKFLVVSSDCSCEEGDGRCPLLGWGSPSTSL